MKKISVIILNWNGLDDTISCLNSLKESRGSDFQLIPIVVDNNSKIDPTEEIKRTFPDTIIIRNSQNLGFSEGNNVGINEALKNNSDLIFLLNNDTIIDNTCIENLLISLKTKPEYSIISPKIYFAPGFEFHRNRYSKKDQGKVIWYNGGEIDWQNIYGKHLDIDKVDNSKASEIKATEFSTGAAMLIKKEVFKEIGLLDKNYFLYYEDTDFCVRAKKAGFKIAVVSRALVWHKNAASSSSGSNLQSYYITRNRLYFGFKYASSRTKIALVREALKLLIKGTLAQKKGIIDFFTHHLGKQS